MAPKKKGNKKGQDDWEADLGETVAPTAPADAAPDANGEDGEDNAGGGGLMAMLRKNKEKRKKKGLPEEDFVQGEDPSADAAKAPEEATLDDEFAMPAKKGKGGGGKGKAGNAKDDAAAEDGAEGGKILTKAEKEKLKKEREKQRKKEQVREILIHSRGMIM
jgi:translation initiation factor 5B